MRETTDTSRPSDRQKIPDGTYSFEIIKVTKMYKGEVPYYIWTLEYEGGVGEQLLLPSMMGELLRTLGCKEIVPNKFDWDTEEVAGISFIATISHRPDKKKPEIIRQQMTDFKKVPKEEEIPF